MSSGCMHDRVERVRKAASGHWKSLLLQAGVDEKYLIKQNNPCPFCGGKDRFSFIDKNGDGYWFCRHCGYGDGFEFLKKYSHQNFFEVVLQLEELLRLPSWIQSAKESVVVTSSVDSKALISKERQRLRRLMRLWAEAKPLTMVGEEDPVKRYLALRRLASMPDSVMIRSHPGLSYVDGDGDIDHVPVFPAMLALVTDAQGQMLTLHRTFLCSTGEKAPVDSPKKLMSGECSGGVIRLYRAQKMLGLAEGIETALAATVLTGIPTWSTLNVQGLKKIEAIPQVVQKIVIFGDNDISYAGAAGAFDAANRLKACGYEVDVRIPKKEGYDWNDVLIAMK